MTLEPEPSGTPAERLPAGTARGGVGMGIVARFLRSRGVVVAAAGLTAVLALPALGLGFLWDDLLQQEVLASAGAGEAAMNLFRFLDPTTRDQPRTKVLLPWWTAPDLRVSFWRPLSALTHWADVRLLLLRDRPRLQHLHSIVWGAALTLLAGVLYRRLFGPGMAAGIAVLLFAVDDAHAMPLGWLANRNALVSSVLALGALLAHDSGRRRGWRAAAFVGPVLFACALLAGELGAAMGPFLLAYALFLDPEPALARRLRTVVPYVVVGMAWQASYFAMGFGAAHSGAYVDPVHSPVRFLWLLPRRLLLLLEGQFGPVPSDLEALSSLPVQRALVVFCALFALLVAGTLRPLIRHDRVARFLCFGMLVGLLPVCSTMPSDRLLLLSGFGAFGLLGLFVAGVAEGAPWLAATGRQRLLPRAFAAAMVLIHGPLAATSLPVRLGQIPKLDRILVKDPARDLPVGPAIAGQHLVCVATQGPFFFAAMQVERRQMGLAMPRAVTALATGSTPIRITRVDARTLRLAPDGGFLPPHGTLAEEGVPPPPLSVRYVNQAFESLFREREAPWHVGDGRDQDGIAVRVTALTADGRPAAIEARFTETLESPAYAWIVYTAGRFRTWNPPAIGETTRTKDVKLPL